MMGRLCHIESCLCNVARDDFGDSFEAFSRRNDIHSPGCMGTEENKISYICWGGGYYIPAIVSNPSGVGIYFDMLVKVGVRENQIYNEF